MKAFRIAAIAVLAMAFTIATVDATTKARSPATMARAATLFLEGLSAEQRANAVFTFEDAERLNWHFIPRVRRGLPFKQMTEPQRAAARALLQTGVSQAGILKVNAIIELELVLREMGGSATQRDPEQYFFSVFGTPSQNQPWGWRFEGHHLSLNFTIRGNSVVATSPAFFGANPAKVPSGSQVGKRALAAEEDLARDLMNSLDSTQRAAATIAAAAPSDIVTMNTLDINPLTPVGIAATALKPDQSAKLVRLINEYLGRMADDIASERRTKLQQTDFGKVTFAWAGPLAVGAPHYYRIQGPSFLVEYDNTQNGANHIHSVWRDFTGDFGRDLLREHYQSTPHNKQ